MVTRDRAENRDGPKVRGGRGGSRGPWFGQGTGPLTPSVWRETGDAGVEGEPCSRTPGARSWRGSCKI